MTKQDVIKFFQDKEYTCSERGLLQEMIEPFEEYNSMLRIVWGKHHSYIEEMKSNEKYLNLKKDIYERATCFGNSSLLASEK
jgi:hypothetical protein